MITLSQVLTLLWQTTLYCMLALGAFAIGMITGALAVVLVKHLIVYIAKKAMGF